MLDSCLTADDSYYRQAVMTLLQIKQQVSKLTADERRELNAYLLRLRNESEEVRAKLSQRKLCMDEGRKVTMEALEARIVASDEQRLLSRLLA